MKKQKTETPFTKKFTLPPNLKFMTPEKGTIYGIVGPAVAKPKTPR
jgi:hypothetical protein